MGTTKAKFVIFNKLGYADEKEFEASTGFVFSDQRTWYNASGWYTLGLEFKDPLLRSITKYSEINFKDEYSDQEIFDIYKKRATYKNRQKAKLYALKEKAYKECRQFISKTFFIDPDVIKDSDIIFRDRSHSFQVGNMIFFYEAIIGDSTFLVVKYHHMHYETFMSFVNGLYLHFYNKGLTSITDYPEQ